jgi:hypothetical protein
MVGANVLTLDEAYRAINFDTIILLFGMMIVVANLQLSGFFSLIAERVVEHAHRPVALLAAVVLVAGFFSAFFVNNTVMPGAHPDGARNHLRFEAESGPLSARDRHGRKHRQHRDHHWQPPKYADWQLLRHRLPFVRGAARPCGPGRSADRDRVHLSGLSK